MSAELSPVLQRELRQDFFVSFRHSQGNLVLQAELLSHVARFYIVGKGHDLSPLFDMNPGFLRFDAPPKNHAKMPEQKVIDNIQLAIRDLKRGIDYAKDDLPAGADTLAAHEIIAADREYQTGKTRRTSRDLHKSFFRQHVLLGQSTGRPAFDEVYGRIRADAATLTEWTPVKALADGWTANHPGMLFDPAGILPDPLPDYDQDL